jgi:hypothetical protein
MIIEATLYRWGIGAMDNDANGLAELDDEILAFFQMTR